MGNRGILHDDKQTLGRKRWTHKAWVTCVLKHKDWHRNVMTPNHYTELFFLDEPTSGRDPALEEQLMHLLRRLTTDDRITFVTTHVLASLDQGDMLVILCAGRLVYAGPPADAPEHFQVNDLPSIYRALAKGDAGIFERRYQTSAFGRAMQARLS